MLKFLYAVNVLSKGLIKFPKFLLAVPNNSLAFVRLEYSFTPDNNFSVPLTVFAIPFGKLDILRKNEVPPSTAEAPTFPPPNAAPIRAPSTAPSTNIPIEYDAELSKFTVNPPSPPFVDAPIAL